MYHMPPLARKTLAVPRVLDMLHILSFPELVSAAGAHHFHRADGCRSIAASNVAGNHTFVSICFLLVPVVSTEVVNQPGIGTSK